MAVSANASDPPSVTCSKRIHPWTRSVGHAQMIIHVVERLAPGGIETLVLDLLRGAKDDMAFSLTGSKQELLASWPALAPFAGRVESFGKRPGIRPALALTIARRLLALRPRAVVLHHVGPLVYGGLAAVLARVPVLVHVEHDAWHYRQPRRQLLMSAFSRLLSPRHVAVSTEIAAVLEGIIPGRRVFVIPPGVDLDRFRPACRTSARQRLGLGAAWRVIGTVGRLSPEKGQGLLVRSLSRLPEDVHLLVAGDGRERAALERVAQECGVASRLHLLGHRDDVEAIYPAFDVFCLPSLSEGLPRSVLEAQACGIPVVATRVGALAQAVCPRTGLIVPAGDEEALTRALEYILGRPASGLSPRSHLEPCLSLARMADGFREVLEGR